MKLKILHKNYLLSRGYHDRKKEMNRNERKDFFLAKTTYSFRILKITVVINKIKEKIYPRENNLLYLNKL